MSDDAPEGVFELTNGEKRHPLWLRLEAEMRKRLQAQREANDGPLDPIQTAQARGHIECLKSLLALADELPPSDDS